MHSTVTARSHEHAGLSTTSQTSLTSSAIAAERDPLTPAVASMIMRAMLERRLRTRHVLASERAPGIVADGNARGHSRAHRRWECSMMKRVILAIVGSMCFAACNFPRPPDVSGDAGPDVSNDANTDTGSTSNACCVTAEECARIGANAPKPCSLGVCVHNECTTASASCDGDEDCSGDMRFCVAETCSVCRSSATCPASTPVCDETSHNCRACSKDRECDSGACDLAAGTCVDGGAILYASPAGTSVDACTRLVPCSLNHAASLVDAAHVYIVLLAGAHTGGATFNGKVAIVAGNLSVIDLAGSSITVGSGSSVRMRDVVLIANQFRNILGSRDAISIDETASLTFENVQATLVGGVNAIRNHGILTILTSIISNGNIIDFGPLIFDRSTLSQAQLQLFLSGVAFEVSNSLFIDGGILVSQDGASNQNGALVLNNTFINGSISCQGVTNKHIESNIFQNTTIITSSDCLYSYNLVNPNANIGGFGNKTGDPLFVDPSSKDFRLNSGSPAIDAANPNRAPPFGHDHDGVPRPQGPGVDMGAFERVQPAS